MKRLVAVLALILGTTALSGCYYDPGYSYVRSSGYQGDAYYGDGGAVYSDGYAAPAYYGSGYYGPGYYGGYAPGVSVDIGTVWYGGSRGHYRGRDYDDYRGRGDHDRGWERGRGAGDAHYGYRGDAHRGGGDSRRGSGGRGGWHGGDHDHHDGH